MNYKSFNKFITEKSAQAAAKDWEKFGNRASRSMAKLNQKCGQLTGDAKSSCLYGQTDDDEKNESYIVEQQARALGGENSRKLKELEAAYSATGRGKTVASGPYAGKMRGELRSMINSLKSGDTQKAKNIEAISSTDVGGGLQRDASGNVSVNQEKAKEQGDKYMSDVAKEGGGTYNPETGQIEFGAKIPLISTGNFASVGKDGKQQTNYGNIAQTVAQAGLMAIPGGAAIGGGIRGGAAAIRGIQGVRGARNIKKAQQIMTNAKGARAAGASKSTVQGMQQAGRETMRKGMSQTSTATRGQAVGQGRALATGAANTGRGMRTGANLGMAPARAAFRGTKGLINAATRGVAPASRVVSGGLRGGGSAVSGGLRGAGSVVGGGLRAGGKLASTIIRNPVKSAAIGAGADFAFNDGKITKDVVNKGAEAMGFNAPFDQKPKTQSTPADKPTTPAKVDPQAGPPVKKQDPKPQPEMSTLADRPPATTATPNTGGSSTSTAPATTTAAAAATKFVPQEVPANATPEERQRIATANLEGSQKARNQRDFGTETPTETQIQKRSEASRSKTAARRASRDEIMSDSSSPAMKKAQAEIDKKNKSRKTRGLPPLNDTVTDRIKARRANAAVSAAGAAAAATAAAEPTAGSALQQAEDEGRARPGSSKDMEAGSRGEVTKNTANPDAILPPGAVNFTNKIFDPNYGVEMPFGMGKLPVGAAMSGVADASDGVTRYMEKSGVGGLQTPAAIAMGAAYGVDPRALGAGKTDVSGNRRAPVTPANRVDPNAAPAAAKSNITRDQVNTDDNLRTALGAQSAEGQNKDSGTDIDKARNDVGAGSAAIKPGETASTARSRISDDMGKQGKSSDEITNELKRLGLLSASFGAGTAVANQRTSGNQPRTVNQSRTSGPTTPMQ